MSEHRTPGEMLDLSGLVAIVTGASGNLGAGIARRFAAAGARLVLHHHRGADAAAALARELDAVTFGGDLTDPAACAALVDTALAHYGRLDVLVNNAGIQPVTPLADLDDAEWRRVVDADLNAVFACTRAAVAAMTAGSGNGGPPASRAGGAPACGGVAGGGGSVVHIASIEGTQPAFGHAHYSAAKAAVIMHARAAALEYGPLGIRVNTVSPGLVDRAGLADDWPEGVGRWRAAAPLGRLGTPADVGDACVFLASPLARWITGHDLVVDGGVSAHPSW